MLSSQFNSGYRHQLTIKPLVKGFFDTFIFSSYPNRTTFCFGSFKNRVGERKNETRKTQMSSRNGDHF